MSAKRNKTKSSLLPGQADGRSRLRSGLALAALVLLTLTVFAPSLSYEFINYDLYDQLLNNEKVRSLGPANLYRIFTELSVASYYPVRLLSFAVDYAIWGYEPFGYHLSSVLIHTTSVVLFYLLVMRLMRRQAEPGTPAAFIPAELWSALAAAAFAIHPVVVETVCLQGAREEQLMMLFTLGCLHAHAGTAIGEAAGRRRMILHVTAGFCAAAAGMSSAMGAAVPLIVSGFDLAFLRDDKLRRWLRGTWFLWLVGGGIVALKVLAHGETIVYEHMQIHPIERFRVVLATYGLNVRTLFWPTQLTLFYGHDVPARLTDPAVLAGGGLLLATGAALWLVRRRPLGLFGMLWFLAALAPSAQVIPHQHFRADRFLYSPLAGLVLALFGGVWAWRRLAAGRAALGRSRLMVAGAGIVLIALLVTNLAQLRHWADDVTLFTHCINVRPAHVAYNNRATKRARLAVKKIELASQVQLEATEAMNVGDGRRAEQLRAIAKTEREEAESMLRMAAEDFGAALALLPDDDLQRVNQLTNRAHAYYRLGAYDQAIEDCTAALAMKPDLAKAYHRRGLSYMSKANDFLAQGDQAATDRLARRAQADLRAVLKIDPDSLFAQEARDNLARLHEAGY